MNTEQFGRFPLGDPAVVGRRRTWMGTLVLGLTVPAVFTMADLHWQMGFDGWRVAHLITFSILFTLVAFGAVQALLGWWWRSREDKDPWQIEKSVPAAAEGAPLGADAVTAIVLPVYNEDPSRVLEGLRVMYESIQATGHLATFEFFILSDSTDPNRWIEEETAWVALTKQLGARGRIFYRRRRLNTNKKAGNLADFCRRWGRRYRYMLVLDADSIMTGDTVVKMVRMMERNPGVGIIQTVPRLVRGETFFARLQQFASRLYGPVFASGIGSWQLGESNYWGHNAIIRTAPFIAHCSLPDLPGNEPFGGRILSHDYVEAALMRRGGWAVWLARDLAGSYEEAPANLIDHAKRDRRWLQGNLQHAWLLAARGLQPVNRLHLLLGIMAYVASPLWLGFLLLSMAVVVDPSIGVRARDGVTGMGLPFAWQAMGLFGGTLLLLFLPKILALWDLRRQPEAVSGFGGWGTVILGVGVETVVFTLMAPVLMVFHSKFILLTLTGRGVQWIAQRRGAAGEPDWREAILTHGGQTGLGVVLGGLAWSISPALFWWMSPIVAGLSLSIPLSILTSQRDLGAWLRGFGVLSVPEENQPADVLQRLSERLELCRRRGVMLPELASDDGILHVVLDPYVNAVHLSMLPDRGQRVVASDRFLSLSEKLLRAGPGALTRTEKLSLLQDATSLAELHRLIWIRPVDTLAPWWQLAIRQHNAVMPVSPTALYR